MKSLYQRLIEYNNEGYYPMHMPGHKRHINLLPMENAYSIDITEIEGFDNLHDPQDVLKDSMERAARLYHSEHTHFLVNGSTVGILVGIAASTKKGDKIIVARNCHKSVYNAIFLNELKPLYIYPQIIEKYGIHGGILPEDIEKLLTNNPDTKLVVITSPTYEGVISDVNAIAKVCHRYGVPCMVDEAHGSHFGFSEFSPQNSVQKGADIVIHSLHKTLPSFTQTALIHINSTLVDYNRIKDYLSIYQTSSPSYVLMAGIDRCMELLESQGEQLFIEFQFNLFSFSNKIKKLKNIRICGGNKGDYKQFTKRVSGVYDYDRSKIVISVKGTGITGKELYDTLLEKYKIQMEMLSKDYVLAITSIFDVEEGFQRLEDALFQIDKDIEKKRLKMGEKKSIEKEDDVRLSNKTYLTLLALTPYEAYWKEGEEILLLESEGRIAKDYMYLYPPGNPLIVPGERISKEFIDDVKEYKLHGLTLKGFADKESEYIKVVKE